MENNNNINHENPNIIKRYPFNGRTKYLIDKFYIFGYEPNSLNKLIIQNNKRKKQLLSIAKKLKNEEPNNVDKIESKITLDEYPNLLNEITSDYKKQMPDKNLIMSMIFPNKVNIYMKTEFNKKYSVQQNSNRATTYDGIDMQKSKSVFFDDKEFINIEKKGKKYGEKEKNNLKILDTRQYNVIFAYNPQTDKNSKKSINGFAFIFYKKWKERQKVKDFIFTFYVPMTFCIISEYPYFNSYYILCNQIIQLFQSSKIEIPIEIIIYNIINFTLSPINGDVLLNIEPKIFPSTKKFVQSLSLNKNKKLKKDFLIIKEEEESNDDIQTKDDNQTTLNNQKQKVKGSPLLNNQKPQIFDKRFSDNLENLSPVLTKKRKIDINKQITDINIRNTLGFNSDMKMSKFASQIYDNNDFQDIKFQRLSGYPVIQYNLSKILFNTLSIQDIILTFFYSFLEKDILFFSSNLEYLSLTIYSYSNLNFPLNDEKYYFYTACVSYEDFVNDNSPFVGTAFTTILGINSAYNAEYLSKIKQKEHLAVDLDNGVLYQVEDKNNKDKHFFDFVKKTCKKESEKNTLLEKEIKQLYENLENCMKNENNNDMTIIPSCSTKIIKRPVKKSSIYLEYNEKEIRNQNKNIQESFYRFINYLCLYFYQNLTLISNEDKIYLNEMTKNKNVDPDAMNVIFHKDYSKSKNSYTKEEIYFLDELSETMKFESFVYSFIQSYNPIDLYKIPLTFIEEFLSNLSRKKFTSTQKLNYFSIIDSLYKKKGTEKVYVDFNPFYSEYCKKLKNYFGRELYDTNNCHGLKKKVREKYLKVSLSDTPEGKLLDKLTYDEYILDNKFLIKYMLYLKNLKKEEYYHMFHLASSLEQNIIKNISVVDIENNIEKFLNNSESSYKKDICCSNIILLFALCIKTLVNFSDCQSFLSILFNNFIVFRKYYTMILNLVYRLMKECLDREDYTNAKNYIFYYYSCINSLRQNLVPNENLMHIILKFNKINFFEFSDKESKDKNKNTISNNKDFFKDSNQIKYVYTTYNFTRNGIIKEPELIEKIKEIKNKEPMKLSIKKKDGKFVRNIEPRINFDNCKFKYSCKIYTQEKILEDLQNQYENYIVNLNEDVLEPKILFEACLNIILHTRNEQFYQNTDILDSFIIIFNIYLDKIMKKNNIKI